LNEKKNIPSHYLERSDTGRRTPKTKLSRRRRTTGKREAGGEFYSRKPKRERVKKGKEMSISALSQGQYTRGTKE